MKYEKSCGVIVFKDNKVLMVRQNSREWSFTKGHVEGEETEEETALRETKEEANVDVKIVGDFKEMITYSPKEGVMKDVVFFLGIPLNNNLKPQKGEIIETKYFTFDEANKIIKHNDLNNHLGGADQQQRHGHQREQGKHHAHAHHFGDGQHAQRQRVKEHHDAPAEAFLHGIQVVGEKAHQAAYLVDLVILAAQILAGVEHAVAQVGLHADGRAEKGDAPQEPPGHDGQDDPHHRHADALQQEIHIKGRFNAVHHDNAVVDAVDHHLIQIGDDQLQVVHRSQGQQAQQQINAVFAVITVDVPTKNHDERSPVHSLKLKKRQCNNYTTNVLFLQGKYYCANTRISCIMKRYQQTWRGHYALREKHNA